MLPLLGEPEPTGWVIQARICRCGCQRQALFLAEPEPARSLPAAAARSAGVDPGGDQLKNLEEAFATTLHRFVYGVPISSPPPST